MRFPETPSSRSARLEGWGGPPISGLPEIGINVRKSGKSDLRCSRRRARGCEILCRLKIAAPHHEGREELRVRQIDRNPL